jgi:hypothetical protein
MYKLIKNSRSLNYSPCKMEVPPLAPGAPGAPGDPGDPQAFQAATRKEIRTMENAFAIIRAEIQGESEVPFDKNVANDVRIKLTTVENFRQARSAMQMRNELLSQGRLVDASRQKSGAAIFFGSGLRRYSRRLEELASMASVFGLRTLAEELTNEGRRLSNDAHRIIVNPSTL